MKKAVIVVIAFFIGAQGLMGQEAEQILDRGKILFQNGRYLDALSSFRELLIDPSFDQYRGDGYFWVSKSLIALERYDDAKRNLEYFLQEFPENENRVESQYQLGRVLYLMGDFNGAIAQLSRFLRNNPSSLFVPNGYYWMGESLFSLGRLDEALVLFRQVSEVFPTSFRAEAARYKASLIQYEKREQELLNLLQWSHEAYLDLVESSQDAQRNYQQAIEAALREGGQEAQNNQTESQNTDEALAQLRSTIAANEARIRALQIENEQLTIQLENSEGLSQESLAEKEAELDRLIALTQDRLEELGVVSPAQP